MQFEVTVTQATGVAVSFKLDEDAKKPVEEAEKAAATANAILKRLVEGRKKFAEEHGDARERRMIRMQEEQVDAQLDAWDRQKVANREALRLLREET